MANFAEWGGIIHSFQLVCEAGWPKIILEMDNVGIDIAINKIFLVLTTSIISCPNHQILKINWIVGTIQIDRSNNELQISQLLGVWTTA